MKKQFLLILAFVTLLHSAIATDNTNGRIVVYFATRVVITSYSIHYTKLYDTANMQNLINELLEFRKSEQGHLTLKVSEHDLVKFRITSYNVCYTKLLRFAWRPAAMVPNKTVPRQIPL